MTNPRVEEARRIRQRAIEAARETWCFELPGCPGSVVVIAWPGQEPISDPKELLRNYGLTDPRRVKRLSESWAAPQPLSLEFEVEAARHHLAELEAELVRRGQLEADGVTAAPEGPEEALPSASATPQTAGDRDDPDNPAPRRHAVAD